MKEFKGKVAVITGGASGIGRSIAGRCAREGMKVVLADVEEKALDSAANELRESGATVLAVRTDVSRSTDVEALAGKAVETFGEVHLLFNNAGVGAGATIWESTLADWQWVMGVNLWGVIHGVHTFVPIMLKQNTDCHIVNTASAEGLVSGPGLGVYKVTKHGVVSLSETLRAELAETGSKIKVSVLCPGWVNTRIPESVRNRPAELQNQSQARPMSPQAIARAQQSMKEMRSGMDPDRVAGFVFDAIMNKRFYIITHPDWKPFIKKRMEEILGA